MCMTNAEIITAYKVSNNIPIDKPLYTASVWYNKGYKIKRGECCKHKVNMWKRSKNKKNIDENEEKSTYCFMKKMYLFEPEQVTKIS